MGIVTAIKQQARRSGRVSVYIDGEFRFGLSKGLATRIRVGQELSEGEIQTLLDHEAAEVAYRRALGYISRRPHTNQEVRIKLRRKQTQEHVIDQVIERLEDLAMLNDRDFAKAWVETRMAFRPRGRKVLRLELRKKGISDEVIQDALADFNDEEAAIRAAEKAYRRYRSLPGEVAKERMLAYLARRGFSYSICRKTVKAMLEDALVSVEESEG